MSNVKAILFDMDGVLIDAKEWHYEALNWALAHFGFNINRYEHLTTYDGLPTVKKLDMLSIERGLPRGLHTFINELKQKKTMKLAAEYCSPRFATQYALSQLQKRGYRMAVCSNSIKESVSTMITLSSIANYFEFLLSNEDVSAPKPSPEIYLKALKLMGVDASECLILEDNENGIEAAKASGAHVMVVETVEDVNLENILTRICEIEGST